MTPLHWIGELIRDLLLSIPLGVARALFVALPIALLVWVLLRKTESRRLRLWASVALGVQILIYLLLA